MRVVVRTRAAAVVPGELRHADAGGTTISADVMPVPAGCTGRTAAGKPCHGRAGPDGRCAAHKENRR